MADESVKVRRTLLLRLKAPTPDAAKVLGSMMQNTAAMYQAFGDAKVRLLRNADDQTQFLQIIEFQADWRSNAAGRRWRATRQCRISCRAGVDVPWGGRCRSL